MTQMKQQHLHRSSSGVGFHPAHRCSRLLLLGALMALLYALFATLALSVISNSSNSGNSGNSSGGRNSNRVAVHAPDSDLVAPGRSRTENVAASSSHLIRRPPPVKQDPPLQLQDPSAPLVDEANSGDGNNKILLGRAMRRDFGDAPQQQVDGSNEGEIGIGDAEVDGEGKNGAGADNDDGTDADKPKEEEEEAVMDEETEGDAGGAGGDPLQRRNFVKPAGVEIVDDDDEKVHVDEEGGADGEDGEEFFGRANAEDEDKDEQEDDKRDVKVIARDDNRPTLKAYIEEVNQKDWEKKPLPVRDAQSSKLKVKEYGQVSSCSKLPEQWPVDEPPTDQDPFLPWIHDVFPTADGEYIQFVAQNRRRCQSGKDFGELKKFLQPNVALFQHVPVKRMASYSDGDGDIAEEPRYRLSTHEEADDDGVETRFICRFSNGEETLSVFNFDYDYHTYRKMYKSTFTEEGFDNHMIWSSQLLFKCPVPTNLVEKIKSGSSVVEDYATLFVDLVPIRTPPRYGIPTQFFQPRFQDAPKVGVDEEFEFDADKEWGDSHVLPRVDDSGRWENIPICKPSLMTYSDPEDAAAETDNKVAIRQESEVEVVSDGDGKRWNLIACAWTSASFHTRGERRHITDNVRRLREWAEFHFMTGFDQIIIYDNSEAQDDGDDTLESVADLFPGQITRINWPSKVCNNRPGTGDNKGERSSQYAAESSCRLRFGAHANWLGSFDIDEYMVPMGGYNTMTDVLHDLEKEGKKIISFQSMRAWPRIDLLEEPKKFVDSNCPEGCFHPNVRENLTFMQTYNCDQEEAPRKNVMPAEKQIYRPDYVLLHFVHYSTITKVSQLNKKQTEEAGIHFRRGYKEHNVKVVDEIKEATMLHSKSVVWDQTRKWEKACKLNNPICKVGFPFPEGKHRSDGVLKNDDGYTYNCFVNKKVENTWVPKLEAALQNRPEAG
jgi:hypothetical protein